MNIRPSAVIRNNYNDISNFCKTTGEPVYLTKNGEGDLVVMDIEAFSRREKMLKLREELIAAEEERLMGKKGYSIDELDKMKVKPGISGYSQAYFRNSITMREKRVNDAWYANNVSLWLDIKILFKTIQTVLFKKNLYTNIEGRK